jgi:hypothetical protein
MLKSLGYEKTAVKDQSELTRCSSPAPNIFMLVLVIVLFPTIIHSQVSVNQI